MSALVGFGGACAQDLEPRQYSNIPIGLNFLATVYAASQGGVLVDPAISLENANLDIAGPGVGYARAVAIAGKSGKIDAALARVCLAGSADYLGQRLTRDVCGLTDVRMRLSVNFLGAPARTLQEFSGYRQNVIVGASLQLSAPTGQYDPDRLANIGSGRWSAKAEIGMSKVLRQWLFELAVAATFYAANDEFYGGVRRQQDPIASVQAHIIRNFSSGIWMAVDATQYAGGRTTTDGIHNPDRQSNSRLGMTASFPINSRQSLKLNFSSGLSTRTGSDFDTVGVGWQYRWGGGV